MRSVIDEEDVNEFKYKSIEKSKVKKKIMDNSMLLLILAIFVMIIAIGDTETSGKLELHKREIDRMRNYGSPTFLNETHILSKKMIDTLSMLELVLKSLISITTLLMCIILCTLYSNKLYLKVLMNFYPNTGSLWTDTELLKSLLLEISICILHLPPLLRGYTGISYKFQVIVFIRIYLVGRLLIEKHKIMQKKSTQLLVSLTKVQLSKEFLGKILFLQYPFQIVATAYFFVLLVGGYTVYLMDDKQNTYMEVLWMLFVTMTTVGFGDYTPSTFAGRVMIGFVSLFGIMILAILVSLVNEVLALKPKEKRILAYVANQEATRQKKIIALNAIGMWYKYHSYRKKHLQILKWVPSYHSGRTNGQVKALIVHHFKVYYLEQKKIKAINLWRNSKQCDAGNNFVPEFVIGDINMMVSDLKSNIDRFTEKFDESYGNSIVNASVKTSSSSTRSHALTSSKSLLTNKDTVEELTGIEARKYDPSNTFQDITRPGEMLHNGKSLRPVSITNGINSRLLETSEKSIPAAVMGLNDMQIGPQTTTLTLQLLQNQAVIMNHNLDESYRDTKEKIVEIQNLINDNETSRDYLYVKSQQEICNLQNIIRNLRHIVEEDIRV